MAREKSKRTARNRARSQWDFAKVRSLNFIKSYRAMKGEALSNPHLRKNTLAVHESRAEDPKRREDRSQEVNTKSRRNIKVPRVAGRIASKQHGNAREAGWYRRSVSIQQQERDSSSLLAPKYIEQRSTYKNKVIKITPQNMNL